ncbi:MAG: cystathionine gamma-synthase [Phycisphaeraceae bacterium]|nr:cystathionine gamma-synthase [Phycisphaerales bacterium]MCB9860448.1 cystathionine gamma-synthase [Phycisphaeraceae bacterium]
MASDDHRFATRCIHAGQQPDPTTGAVMTPIYQTSTYVQASPGVIKDDYDYSRSANPTRKALERNLASLEGARHGLCFASGCAAMDAVLHLLVPGDHIIMSDDVYGGTNRLFNRQFSKHGIEVSLVDFTDLDAVDDAVRKETKLIWLETPSNPMLKVIDIAAVSAIGDKVRAITCVDNTFASPMLQTPLSLGATLVCHSCTKYIGGHSDVVGGALITNDDELFVRLKFVQNSVGAVPGPMDCFLLLRSTKTLHVRMQRHCENAMRIAKHLEQHPAIDRVIYPGLPSHPQHEIAKKQMCGFGGMITVYLNGDIAKARTMLERVKLFALAESLGGAESLIEHPAIMTHASVPEEQRATLGITDSLVRLSVGIEDVEDLIEDLDRSLA